MGCCASIHGPASDTSTNGRSRSPCMEELRLHREIDNMDFFSEADTTEEPGAVSVALTLKARQVVARVKYGMTDDLFQFEREIRQSIPIYTPDDMEYISDWIASVRAAVGSDPFAPIVEEVINTRLHTASEGASRSSSIMTSRTEPAALRSARGSGSATTAPPVPQSSAVVASASAMASGAFVTPPATRSSSAQSTPTHQAPSGIAQLQSPQQRTGGERHREGPRDAPMGIAQFAQQLQHHHPHPGQRAARSPPPPPPPPLAATNAHGAATGLATSGSQLLSPTQHRTKPQLLHAVTLPHAPGAQPPAQPTGGSRRPSDESGRTGPLLEGSGDSPPTRTTSALVDLQHSMPPPALTPPLSPGAHNGHGAGSKYVISPRVATDTTSERSPPEGALSPAHDNGRRVAGLPHPQPRYAPSSDAGASVEDHVPASPLRIGDGTLPGEVPQYA